MSEVRVFSGPLMGVVYILQSLVNSRFYIGSTNHLERRLKEHNDGASRYTRLTKPFKLVFSQRYPTLSEARKVELWLKKQKDSDFLRRIIKEGVIKKTF